MEWITDALDWAKSHQTMIWWMFAATVALLLLTPLAMGWAVVKLPTDYFARTKRPPLFKWEQQSVLRVLYLIAKNVLGFILIIAGIAMLVLPGQGLLTIAIGVVLMNFPGKFRLERWLATRRPVWRSLNWLRRKAKRPKLQRPE